MLCHRTISSPCLGLMEKMTHRRRDKIEAFYPFAKNINVKHLDVVLRLFVQFVEEESRKWFKSLPNASITTWEEMENSFMHKWGEKRDHGYILTKFNAMKKKPDEGILEFTKRFNKLYKSLPTEIKPPQATARVVFTGAFESKFGYTLRERKSSTLDQIQIDALKVEANFS